MLAAIPVTLGRKHWTTHLADNDREAVREFAVLHGTTHQHLSARAVLEAIKGQGIKLPITSKDAWLNYVRQVKSGQA